MAAIRFQEMTLMHIKAYGYYTMASLIMLEIYFLRKAILILNKRYAQDQTGFSLERLLASTQESYLDRINYLKKNEKNAGKIEYGTSLCNPF